MFGLHRSRGAACACWSSYVPAARSSLTRCDCCSIVNNCCSSLETFLIFDLEPVRWERLEVVASFHFCVTTEASSAIRGRMTGDVASPSKKRSALECASATRPSMQQQPQFG